MKDIGGRLIGAASASSDVILIAPFVKVDAVRALLASCPAEASVLCVTRWKADEVLAGVSDLEVLDVLLERGQRGQLRLRADLHAKYYRFDDEVLVGSANLTARALGWALTSNLEILVAPADPNALREEVESEVVFHSAVATEEHRTAVRLAMESLLSAGWTPPPFPPDVVAGEGEDGAGEAEDDAGGPPSLAPSGGSSWTPWCRTPDRLYRAYRGDDRGMTPANYDDARRDLAALGLPEDLQEETFRVLLRSSLMQTSVFEEFDTFIRERPRSIQDLQTLASRLVPDSPFLTAEEAWDTVRAWFVAFFPERYQFELARHGEIVTFGRPIASWTPPERRTPGHQ